MMDECGQVNVPPKDSIVLSAHQPAYLPWLGYFHKMAICDDFVILDCVQFEKNSFANRNKIKTSQGTAWLTIPVLLKGHLQKTIAEIEINNDIDWRSKHFRSLYFNYKKAPFFKQYADFLEDFYKKTWVRLYDATEYLLLFFVSELGIETRIHKQSQIGITSRKQELILDLCRNFCADCFVFGSLGVDYADIEMFKSRGVEVLFQDYKHPVYPQLYGDFVSHLSVLDLLFNVGKEQALEIIISGNITRGEINRSICK